MEGKELKKVFLNYFGKNQHKIIESSSVVPKEDKSLLFVNSGMVQFKNNFLGIDNQYAGLIRACSSQRCIRAGGKHNDLDDVGKDNYHHTFFEMLGNWSFGDYFKKEAVFFAWDFLINVLGLEKERIYVSYFSDDSCGIEEDKETFELWKQYIPEERIIKGNFRDNFWEMAETGPCGPCTEIHYDRIGGRNASNLVNKDDPTVLEIWNVVFMEYNRTERGLLRLEKPCIDTGIGFERLLSIVNNVQSNYLTDLFLPLFDFILESSERTLKIYKDTNSKIDIAYRVLADHSRTIAICLFDDVNFSNEGRGYVLRRITRRAIRFAYEVLKLKRDFLRESVLKASKILELELSLASLELISKEEDLFMKTLDRGIYLFDKVVKEKNYLTGKDAFILYDTYGFPLDLTRILAEERGLKIDEKEFESEKEKAKERSKAIKSGLKIILPDHPLRTDDSYKYSENDLKAKLIYSTKNPDCCVFDKTCFYSEMGGQVGDTGVIYFKKDRELMGVFNVHETKTISGTLFHIGILEGDFTENAELCYNKERKNEIRKNHTATHILNYFLRRSFEGIEQRGSLVSFDKLRFDFFMTRAMTLEEIQRIEDEINDFIQENNVVNTQICTQEELTGNIITMKDEVYPENVRNVQIKGVNHFIQELCGGTHVANTGEIQRFRILFEGSISSNTRRILAITGDCAIKSEDLINKIKAGEINFSNQEIPLLERKLFEEAVNKKLKDQKEEKSILLENEQKIFEEQVLNTKEKLIYELSISLSDKDLQKDLIKKGNKLKESKIKGVVYSKSNENIFFSSYGYEITKEIKENGIVRNVGEISFGNLKMDLEEFKVFLLIIKTIKQVNDDIKNILK